MATSRFDSGIDRYVIQKYNQLEHEVDLYLDNSGTFAGSPSNRFYINPAAILGLSITDTVTNWAADGTLSFMYLPEKAGVRKLENAGQTKSTIIKGAIDNAETLRNYQFRGDGFDLLRVMIAPKSRPNGKNVDASNVIKVDKSDTKWVLSYLFSIYDVQDVNDIPNLKGPAAPYLKCLKLSFHDVRYQLLATSNIEYSTAEKSQSEDRTIMTSTAMAEIINKAIADEEKGGCEEFKINENIPTWDNSKSYIFYTSPAGYSALDDLNYVYANNVSQSDVKTTQGLPLNDLALLHTDRPETYGQLEPLVLTPLSELFKKAGKEQTSPGELQKEHFFITAHTSQEADKGTMLFRAPMGGNEKNIDVKTFKYGQIISYGFVDMSPDFNSNSFRSTPVYSVDIGKRVFNVEFKGNDIIATKDAIAETYIEELYKQGPSKNLFLPTIHKTKKDWNIFPTFSLNGEDSENGKVLRQKNAFHTLIYSGLFQNACIAFKTLGSTLRESGTFIGIDRTQGCEDNSYNNKLCGQWFVVKVDHIFEAGAYMNRIYAIKIHRYKELDQDEQFDGCLEE